MLAGVLGNLAKIEHKQKLRRIRSGIAAAQDAGKWTGRPPAGFVVKNGYLRVDASEYLHVREAVARVDRGEAYAEVADATGVSPSTLRALADDRRELYLAGEADDDRVDAALADVCPLEDLREDRTDDPAELRERVERLEDAVGE